MDEEKIELTLNSMINLMFDQYLPIYCNQKKLLSDVFGSYYENCAEAYGYQVLPDQTMIRDLRSSRRTTLPKDMRVYYSGCKGREWMKTDMYRLIDEVAPTAHQRDDLRTQLLSLASASTNLNKQDKEYILEYKEVPPEHQVQELLARMMVTAYYYSLKK